MPLQVIRLTEAPVEDQELREVQRGIVDKLNRFTAAVVDAVRALEALPILRGRLLTSQAVGTSSTAIYHNLGRVPVGWFIVRKLASVTVYETGTATSTTLNLISSSAATLDIWVF